VYCLVLHANTFAGKAATQAARERGYDLILVERVPWDDPPDNSFVIDTSDPKDIENLVRKLEKECLRVDFLITCPALNANEWVDADFRAFEEFSLVDWDRIIRENLNAQMLFCRFFGKGMRERGMGRILQLASNVALDPHDPRHFSGMSTEFGLVHAPAAYACAMAGVLALTRHLAAEYQDSGVLINSMVFGPLAEAEPEPHLESYKNRIPLGRIMTAEDLKNALDIFLDPESSYITGQNLNADGGVSIW